MEEEPRANWKDILWEKWKFQWVIVLVVIMELGLVLLWTAIRWLFEKGIHWIDPTGSDILITGLKWFYEITTLLIVVYSGIKHALWMIKRINQESREDLVKEQKALNERIAFDTAQKGTKHQVSEPVPPERLP